MGIKKKDAAHPPDELATTHNQPSTGSFRNVLTNRPFMLLWIAQLLSQIGFNAANYGVLTAVARITHGSVILSGVAIISFTLPAVPFSLLAGVYVDYLDKRLVLWVSNALRAIATFLIVIALIWNPNGLLFLFLLNFFISMVTQFFMPAESSAIPLLVGTENLVPALSLFNITLNIAQAIGFLVLGRVIEDLFSTFKLPLGFTTATITADDMFFAVIAVTYLVCTVLVRLIPRTRLQASLQSEGSLPRSPGKEMWAIVQRDIKGTWKFMRRDRKLYVALMQVSFMGILLLVIAELAPVFVVQILGLPSTDLTLLFAPAGIGLVLGALLMPLATRYLKKSLVIFIGSVLTAAGMILLPVSQILARQIPLLHPWALFMVGALAFVLGFALDMVNIPAQTVLQERAPEEERGRVLSFQFMLNNAGSIPVLLFAGLIGQALGISIIMYILGGAILLFQWWSTRYEAHAQKTGAL